ncbi:hypothetical protein AB2N08_18210 [Massilia aurea]|uniref:hypothetical protein n=1 Tax=Massilia aurea TaxID=373040 RepID=UPI0034618FF0
MYVTLVTIKVPSGIARVAIMKTEDAIRIMEINELTAFVVSSAMIPRRYPPRIQTRQANATPESGSIYEHTQRVRTIRLSLFALLLKVFP